MRGLQWISWVIWKRKKNDYCKCSALRENEIKLLLKVETLDEIDQNKRKMDSLKQKL